MNEVNMINNIPIIVLTPIKNEDWILDTFLRITSLLADYIIIIDQNSDDNSYAILNKYPKVIYLKNLKEDYNEYYRQNILIEKARSIIEGKKILLALDADEIIPLSCIESPEWNYISQLDEGTRLLFKKPDVLPGGETYLNYSNYFLIGYMDDGMPHAGQKFHSPRVPPGRNEYNVESISFLHLAMIRKSEYQSRQRLYSILENINKSSTLRIRYRKYSRTFQKIRYSNFLKNIPENYISDYEKIGFFIKKIRSTEQNNYNKRILFEFKKFGTKMFWMEDIWYVDYSSINADLGNIYREDIKYPPLILSILREFFIITYSWVVKIKILIIKSRFRLKSIYYFNS
ncbi:glycosyltransferase family 2 protein [Persicitalea jodogahamensis]|uniref:Glycosyltransferase n=1 Tax=Persicitalea jodogahamensis TaxID=402147 RepID=A0A8J3G853_9BACT|nr:glycosyltransferase family 2 protein [Persicitalea jodogahamensis]GHB62916.1 hypothetical protein GCM10007390_15940 [Persicitalea jodogahamensis]